MVPLRSSLLPLLCAIALSSLASPANAVTTIVAAFDNWVRNDNVTATNPTDPFLGLRGPVTFFDAKEAFLQFDLPAGGPITGATLRLDGTGHSGTNTLEVSLVEVPMNIATVTWNTRPAYGTVLGSGPVNNGVHTIPISTTLMTPGTTILLRLRMTNNGWGSFNSIDGSPTVPELDLTITPLFADVTTAPLAPPSTHNGVAWGDYDDDGDPDLYVVSSNPGSSHLFRNDAGVFVDVTTSPVNGGPATFAAAWGDYDHDGLLDLFATGSSNNQLMKNLGGDVFQVTTHSPISGFGGAPRNAAWGDYDIDGDLDLYVVSAAGGAPNKLYENQGGTFVDGTIGPVAGVADHIVCASADYDTDGDLDIFVSGNGPDQLFENLGGEFVDATGALGSGAPGRGAVWGDYDNDGDMDLYVSFASGVSNVLYRNDGSGTFVNVTPGGLGDTADSYGAVWFDYDNDTDLDLFYVNANASNRLHRNEGGGVFVDVTSGDLADLNVNRSVAAADYDGDGDLDLYYTTGTSGGGQTNILLRNDASGSNHWLQVDLDGSVSNPHGIGARVRIVSGGVSQIRGISGGAGYLSQDEPIAAFGLGAATTVDSIIVTWPSRIVQTLTAVAADQRMHVMEPVPEWLDRTTAATAGNPTSGTGSAWFDYDGDGDSDLYLTVSNAANIVARNEGIGGWTKVIDGVLGDAGLSVSASVGDYDNDGDDDLYVINAGQPSKLFRNDGNGTWVDATTAPLDDATDAKNVAWADYDGDGDLDLFKTGSPATANRLFRNDGGGTFVIASHPAGAGSDYGMAWGDYDDDGDQDLYIGNQLASNRLLRNDAGTLVDATPAALTDASGDSRSVAWADFDGDLDLDLSVVNTNTDVRLFRNDGGGVFVDVGTLVPAGTSGRSHNWADVDNDGDLDLYVGRNAPNRLMRNDGGAFVDVTSAPIDVSGSTAAISFGDFDADGDLDLHLEDALNFETARLFENNQSTGNHWLHVRLAGDHSNGSGIGARIRVVTASGSQIREVSAGQGRASVNSLTAEFGLGSETIADSVLVHWPSGLLQCLTDIAADQIITIAETEFVDVTSGPMAFNGPTLGVSWGDIDGDGDEDLAYVGDFGVHVLENVGFDAFTGPTVLTGSPTFSAPWADMDHDGDLDLYVAKRFEAANQLWRNDGGTLVALSGTGTEIGFHALAASWGDADGDGDPDLYRPAGQPNSNRLLINECRETFADATGPLDSGVQQASGTWADYDNDGDSDLFLATNVAASRLFRNDNSVFVDVTPGPLATPTFAAVWGDYDNDGDLDIFSAAGNAGPNGIYRNDGGNTFVLMFTLSSQALDATWGDYDNDGDLDLYLARNGPPNQLFRNDSGLFVDWSLGPLGNTGNTQSAAWADHDGDGDLDLVIANFANSNKLLRNEVGSKNHWLEVDLDGSMSAASGIGARVRIVAGGQAQIREVQGGTGYNSANSMIMHFGLGAETSVDSVIVRWPSSVVTVVTSVAADQKITVVEPNQAPVADTIAPLQVYENEFLAFSFTATDAESLALVFCPVSLPSGATVDIETGAFTWTPDFTQAGMHTAIVAVTDNGLDDTVNVSIEVLDVPEGPHIVAITDIPNDQGRQVDVHWKPSEYDETGDGVLITGYALYRRIDPILTAKQPAPITRARKGNRSAASSSPKEPIRSFAFPPGDWHYVTTVPARLDDNYHVVAPTLVDSTDEHGIQWSTFFVSALTESNEVFHDGVPDSGYSVDNLAPSIPPAFALQIVIGPHVLLNWEAVEDLDFRYYTVHRGATPDFELTEANRLGYTIGLTFTDTNPIATAYYRVAAVDFSGNVGEGATSLLADVTGAPGFREGVLALHPAMPDPARSSTALHFELPTPGSAKLSVYDTQGRVVRSWGPQAFPAGLTRIDWDLRARSGRGVSPGVYFYRLQTGGQLLTERVVVIGR